MNYDLNLANNMFGALNSETRTRLHAVIQAPTIETWNDAYSIILGPEGKWGTINLWQAVCALNPSYTRIGKVTDIKGNMVEEWKRIPDSATIIEAINYATH